MKIRLIVFSLLLTSSPALACDFFGGAMPGQCPPEATKTWWSGSWATRELDKSGKALTAFTTLKPDETYKTTLVYDSGGRLEHWGRYKIHVNKDLASNFAESDVPDQSAETAQIDLGVRTAVQNGSADFGGALPNLPPPTPTPPRRVNCLQGDIEYFVEGSDPKLEYKSPQRFSFITQGDGYVRVSGPGADHVLARRYALLK
jgi:hypothetical protein